MKFFRWCFLLAPVSAIFTSHTFANEDWWFDIEVIAFKRDVSLNELEEQFTLASSLAAPSAQADLITAVIRPDISALKQGLPLCDVDTTISLPASDLLYVPPSDVDFSALPPLPQAVNDGIAHAAENESKLSMASAASFVAGEETTQLAGEALPVIEGEEYSQEVAVNAAEPSTVTGAELAVQDDEIERPTATEITKLWLSFFGVSLPSMTNEQGQESGVYSPQNITISVPKFRFCEPVTPWMDIAVLDGQKTVKVNAPDNRLPSPAALPIIIEGYDWPRAPKPHLLSIDEHALGSISKQIRSNRGLERLFHIAWRQPVMFGKDNAFDVRLFGGKNYASSFSMSGQPIRRPIQEKTDDTVVANRPSIAQYDDAFSNITSVDTSQLITLSADASHNDNTDDSSNRDIPAVRDIFAKLEDKLASPTPIDLNKFTDLDKTSVIGEDSEEIDDSLRAPIWEIDGTMKVFLKYINRVPYLHIDSELFYRHPVADSYFSVEPVLLDGDNSAMAESYLKDSQFDGTKLSSMRLVALPLKEQRRVISTQLHYFDHPLFGFIAQIRRYKRPPIEAKAEN